MSKVLTSAVMLLPGGCTVGFFVHDFGFYIHLFPLLAAIAFIVKIVLEK